MNMEALLRPLIYLSKKCWQVFISATYDFWNDECYKNASTLAFYTLQSIIPLLAALLGIAKGFGFEERFQNLITKTFQEQEQVLSYAIEIAHNMLKHTQGGVILGFGVLFLFWTTINLLDYIESVFNHIWKIRCSRSVFQKFTDFISILVVCPIVFIFSSSLTIYLKTQIAYLQEYNKLLEEFGTVLLWFFRFTPWFLSSVLFFLLYQLIPNTKMRLGSRVFASLLAGVAFQLWQLIFIYLQVRIFSYNLIYGTVALLPLFIIWLQFSWIIALSCAEIAANIENNEFTLVTRHNTPVVKANKKQLCILILYYCYQKFYSQESPLDQKALSKILQLPRDSVQHLLDMLIQGHLLVAAQQADHEICYLPAVDPNSQRIKDIYDLIEKQSNGEWDILKTEEMDKVHHLVSLLDKDLSCSSANINLEDLITHIGK